MVDNMKVTQRFEKLCPFCPQVSYGYHFKTWNGLLHHVHKEHLRVIKRSSAYENSWYFRGEKWKAGQLIFIRIYDVFYSKFHDLDIKSPEECEKLLYAYVTDDPSYRGIKTKTEAKK
jgi:hypothetical protein